MRLERSQTYDVAPGPVLVVERLGDAKQLRLYPRDYLTMIPANPTATCLVVCT